MGAEENGGGDKEVGKPASQVTEGNGGGGIYHLG